MTLRVVAEEKEYRGSLLTDYEEKHSNTHRASIMCTPDSHTRNMRTDMFTPK